MSCKEIQHTPQHFIFQYNYFERINALLLTTEIRGKLFKWLMDYSHLLVWY